MKMIRWSGLAAFVLIIALSVIVGFFFLDNWVKRSIESAGFAINGAEVNVGKLDLTLNPIGFKLADIEISNPDKPTHNTVEIADIQLALNLPQLFLGNVRIFDAQVMDIAADTERARIAKVKEADVVSGDDAPNAVQQKVEAISQSLPSVNEVIAQNTQNTQQAFEAAKQSLSNSEASLTQAIDDLPKTEQLDDYQQKIAQIDALELNSLTDIQTASELVAELAEQVARDKQAIEQAKTAMNDAISDSRSALDNVVQAPGKDLADIQEQYPLNAASALKVAEVLLGDDFVRRVQQAQYWYVKASPWLARLRPEPTETQEQPSRLEGEFVRFAHPDPTAEFQLDNAGVSFIADGWPWQLAVANVSTAKPDGALPARLLLQRGTNEDAALRVEGLLDTINGVSQDTYTFSGQGVEVGSSQTQIGDADIRWTPEPADVEGSIVANDGELDGTITLTFPSNQFETIGQGQMVRLLSDALAGVNAFKVDIVVGGRALSPSLSIRSDLDNQFSNALQGAAKARYQQWVGSVQDELLVKANELKAPLESEFDGLKAQRQAAEARIAAFETQVVDELERLKQKANQQKQRIEDAAKDAIKDEAGKVLDRFSF